MKESGITASTTDHLVARLIAAGVQLPEFLVMRVSADGATHWLSVDYVPVAEHWHQAVDQEPLSMTTLDFMSALARAMTLVLGEWVRLKRGNAPSLQQDRRVAWKLLHRVIVDWLAQTGPADLNAATSIWQQQSVRLADLSKENAVAWQAWEVVQAIPGMSGLRASLQRHVSTLLAPAVEEPPRVCGLRSLAS